MPGPPARVLIVDDSAVARRFLSGIVARDPELELAGVVENGLVALQKLAEISVDLVVMDVEMPGMDGIEAVTKIRRQWPKLPVVMCSSMTTPGADTTRRVLQAGATDCLALPSALAGDDQTAFREAFLTMCKALTGTSARAPAAAVPVRAVTPIAALTAAPAAGRIAPKRPGILAIGCSTGGPNALAVVFPDLPRDIGVPIVITQHMPPLFTKMLAERLTSISQIPVKEAEHGDILEPNRGYIAPGDYHMTLRRDGVGVRVALNQDPQEHSCRPAVDVMFRSVAKVYGPDIIAAVLTGMGRDGAKGSKSVADAGGWVITQDAESCVIPSMPNAVVELGASHERAELTRLGTLFGLRCNPGATQMRRASNS